MTTPTSPTPPPELSLGIKSALESGTSVLFVGAGIGYCAFEQGKPAPMPDAGKLATELATKFNIDAGGTTELAKIAQVVEIRKGRPELTAYLSKRLIMFEPNESIQWIPTVRWGAIFTTNYDRLIERAYELCAKPVQTPVVISTTSSLKAVDARFQVPIYKIHGALYDTDQPHVLITENDYAKFRQYRKMLFEILKREMATSTFIYAGYSHNDVNWKQILVEIKEEFTPSVLPKSYRICPTTPPLDKELLGAQNIETIDQTFDAFVQSAKSCLDPSVFDSSKISKWARQVPADLKGAYDRNPAATLRLLNSWTYVNGTNFAEAANTQRFLKGETPNWSLIGSSIQFERDIEEPLLDDLLDFATTSSHATKCILLLAPAGFGITTTLMSLAVSYVKANAGPVFFHKPGTALNVGDVEYASGLFTTSPLFVIDNGADFARTIKDSLLRLKDINTRACLMIGARRNEWRQLYLTIKGKEFAIDSLSEPEILRLLEMLESNQALGELTDLAPELRASAIREKHNRQLLVTLRELTEGESFEAIIESEYRNIRSETARRLYAVVACAYQTKKPLRDSVIATVLGKELPEVYSETKDATDGVVEFDCIDEGRGTHAGKCRHHYIAEVVWQKCLSRDQREIILLKILEALNLTYPIDHQLFDDLVRSDKQIDTLERFESKVQFFESACKKDPLNAYIKQHYARMLDREDKLELALNEIESAINMQSKLRVLHHTKGVILKHMAMMIPSIELARKRMVQSEHVLKGVAEKDGKDAHAFQTLSELYLGWAQRVERDHEKEASDYVEKCEEVIREGLKTVRNKDGLYIASSRLQEWIGNTPGAIDALIKAKPNPIAIYLLANVHIQRGEPEKAVELLHPLVNADPTEPRTNLLYANAMLLSGHDYDSVIAILKLAIFYGVRNHRYVATYGGVLFLNNNFTEAEEVFRAADNNQFTCDELHAIVFQPMDMADLSKPVNLTGTVGNVRAGYAFITVPGYPNIFSPASKWGKLVLRANLKVEFELAFTCRGPIARNLRAV